MSSLEVQRVKSRLAALEKYPNFYDEMWWWLWHSIRKDIRAVNDPPELLNWLRRLRNERKESRGLSG